MESWELSSYLEPGRFIIQLLVVSVLVPWTIKELNQDSLIYSCSCSILGSIQVLFLVLSMVLFLFLFYPWFYSCSIPGSILGSIPVLSLVLSSCIPFYPCSTPVLSSAILFYPVISSISNLNLLLYVTLLLEPCVHGTGTPSSPQE